MNPGSQCSSRHWIPGPATITCENAAPRVNFGRQWLDKSILEIYREDIVRFRVLLSGDVQEDALELISAGQVPKLRSLQVHNSTVYRWNRPCYGISDNGKPHLTH